MSKSAELKLTLKEKLLEKIKKKKSVSLGELSRDFDRSKESISKAIAELNEEGYGISYEEDSRQVVFGKKEKLAPLTLSQLKGKTARIGIISDTHLGSRYSSLSLVHLAYKEFEKQKVQVVLHAGDLVDGTKMYRGQEQEVFLHGVEDSVEYTVENYPVIKGIKTMIISGNHDLSYFRSSGANVVRQIALRRKDMIWRGDCYADFMFKEFSITMAHPAGGRTYALSYKAQKFVTAEVTASIAMEKKPPGLVIMGHLHSYASFKEVSTYSLMCPCLQKITPFMRDRAMYPNIGFVILTLKFNSEGKIKRFLPEFYDCVGLIRENDY